ncbi:MAG: hypothetical protein E6Q76_02160 [Rhizobium sp.]|nr:MAG: hypothetical protein E6Q76_02160 [Rhizobium sp.]
MLISVPITQAHIDQGTRDSCRGCAAALALAAVTHPSTKIAVQSYRVTIDGWPCEPSPELGRFVMAFDAGKPVEPCAFQLDVPERALNRFKEFVAAA